nr:unnamed protein product [Spirometra erinaceieuropaei]
MGMKLEIARNTCGLALSSGGTIVIVKAAIMSRPILAVRNVHSLLGNPRSKQLGKRTALVARELARYKVDIAALRETSLSKQAHLEEVDAGCIV